MDSDCGGGVRRELRDLALLLLNEMLHSPPSVYFTLEYYHMVTIPSGARSIRISELNVSTSYIAVRNALKTYYLNGHWTVDWPGRYKFSGTAFEYRRSYREPESLTSTGPTNETLVVEVHSSFMVSGAWTLGSSGVSVGSKLWVSF